MRAQLRLADLYRLAGRASEARAIEADLLAALSHADADYPMLVELKRRKQLAASGDVRSVMRTP